MKRTLFYSASMTASWAWGSSLMVGMAIVLERGLLPFIIWATANSLMIPFFGFMVQKYPQFEKTTSTKPFILLMTIMQFFVTWVNMQALYMVSVNFGFSDMWGKIFASVVAITFILMVFKHGLELSVKTDLYQWAIMYVGVIAIIVIGFFTADIQPIEMLTDEKHISWAIFGACSLLCGGFIDLQQWQRAKVVIAEKRQIAFYIAGGLFALYMTLLAVMAQFEFTYVMGILLLIVAFMITTSTLDSVGVAMQEMGGNKIGALLGIIAVASWQIVYSMGIIHIWNMYGTFRLVVVGVMIITIVSWATVGNHRPIAKRRKRK